MWRGREGFHAKHVRGVFAPLVNVVHTLFIPWQYWASLISCMAVGSRDNTAPCCWRISHRVFGHSRHALFHEQGTDPRKEAAGV